MESAGLADEDESSPLNRDTPSHPRDDGCPQPEPEVTEEEKDDRIPYDRGWGWMVTFGVFINYVFLSGYYKSSGLFFVELLEKFNAPASKTALLFAVRGAAYSVSGFYVMTVLMTKAEARKLVLLGGLLMSLSAVLSSLADHLVLLICLQSLLLAVGYGMLISPGQVLMGRYFRKRRSLALTLSECGVSIGNIIVPPLVSYLLDQYALSGALLLYGGLCLNSLPAGLLHRPVSQYYRRRRRSLQNSESGLADVPVAPHDDQAAGVPLFAKDDKEPEPEEDVTSEALTSPATSPGRNGDEDQFKEDCTNPADTRLVDCEVSLQLDNRSQKKNGTHGNKNLSQCVDLTKDDGNDNDNVCRRAIRSVLQCPQTLASTLDFSLFKLPLFCLFMLFVTFSFFIGVPLDYLPALVSENGLTDSQAALLLSLIGGLDLVCRLACGFIINMNIVSAKTMTIISYAVLGIVMHFVRYMTSFEHFVALAIVQGLMGSVGNCLFPVLVIEFVGIENMAKCIGFNQLVAGASMAGFYPLLGYIRDVTGSYVMVYHVIGLCMLITAGILCCERPVRRFQTRACNQKPLNNRTVLTPMKT